MATYSKSLLVLATWGVIVGSACMPSRSVENLNSARPQRPPELDQLDAFVGRWAWEGEGRVAGQDQPVTFSGTRESRWEGDGWYLVTREVGNLEGLAESRTLLVWSYDARARKFRTSYVDSMGTSMVGTAAFNDRTQTWHLESKSRGPSGMTRARGHVRFPNPDTMTWNWTEHDMGGLRKTMELTGTCERQR